MSRLPVLLALLLPACAGGEEWLLRLEPAPRPPPAGDFERRVAATVAALRAHAEASQAPLREALRRRGLAHRPFWVANAVLVRAAPGRRGELLGLPGVRSLEPNRPFATALPKALPVGERAKAVEWGVARVKAPLLWSLGFLGQGVVIGGQDTGYRWDHPALRASYRGWNGVSASHDHHWHDAIRSLLGPGSNPCGLALPAPCDDHNHGSHTMGTMVGDDGLGNQIGVAPQARWIGCRNMERGVGTPATYLECFQWFLAPTDLAGNNPSPALAPHVINNSWACPPSEGCTLPDALREAVENVRAAGILVVAAAGNSGPGCATVQHPPAIHAASLAVGATDAGDAIAGFSSRGPVLADGSGRLKPELAAPGVSIRSALRHGGYGLSSGTSMAAPHVAGVAALLMSARPALKGDPERVERLLKATAAPQTAAQDCGPYPGGAVPNAVYGHGIVDAWAAWQELEGWVFWNGFE
ncbi:MAG: S8 family serine peptidase [Xanthomonadales bacterium]|nr:S8 family serine peptidase [Xanthomonadales bacterium]